jgi:hypothetical protein
MSNNTGVPEEPHQIVTPFQLRTQSTPIIQVISPTGETSPSYQESVYTYQPLSHRQQSWQQRSSTGYENHNSYQRSPSPLDTLATTAVNSQSTWSPQLPVGSRQSSSASAARPSSRGSSPIPQTRHSEFGLSLSIATPNREAVEAIVRAYRNAKALNHEQYPMDISTFVQTLVQSIEPHSPQSMPGSTSGATADNLESPNGGRVQCPQCPKKVKRLCDLKYDLVQ